MDMIAARASAFDQPTENMDDALPLLYQSGYITIKDYDKETDFYILSIPNKEVRTGFVENMILLYTGINKTTRRVLPCVFGVHSSTTTLSLPCRR